MPGTLSNVIIHVDDLERASSFYWHVLGWKVVRLGNSELLIVQTGSILANGVHVWLRLRTLSPKTTQTASVEIVVTVDDIDATLRKVVQHGGQNLGLSKSIDGVAAAVSVCDPFGNILALLEVQYSTS